MRSIVYIEAERRGFFAAAGLPVCYNQVSNSQQQFESLFSGQYAMILTTADNAVNRYVNAQLPVQIVAGIDQGANLSLIASSANGIQSIADLRDKPIAVDAPDSGYVFALRKILANNGLYLEQNDYSLQLIGGSAQRYQAMVAGKTSTGDPVYATILGMPFSELSSSVSTLITLGDFSAYVAPYQGTSLVVTRDYAEQQAETLVAFLRALIQGRRFAAGPANESTVIADIAATYSITTRIATDIYRDALNPVTGENVDMQINSRGLINTIELRQGSRGFRQSVNSNELVVSGQNGLYNEMFWKQALPL